MPVLLLGEAMPYFHLKSLCGSEVSWRDYPDQIVVVNFWSAKCPWAEKADRELVEAYQSLGWEGRVAILPVASNVTEPEADLRRVSEERGLPDVLLDADHQVADLFGAATTPHCFIADADGILRYQGAFNDLTFRQRTPTRTYVIEAVQALLQGLPVPVSETAPYGCSIIRFA